MLWLYIISTYDWNKIDKYVSQTKVVWAGNDKALLGGW